MYSLYLDSLLLPVTPKKVQMVIGGRSRLVTLINDGQASIPLGPELTQISFTALLPQAEYPFARYEGGFQGAEIYLAKLEELKAEKKAFRFVLSRWTPSGKQLFDTNLCVTLEEYSIEEAAGNGFDIEVKVFLRQYRSLSTKELEIDADLPGAPVILEETRAVDSEASSSSGGSSSSRKDKGIIAPSTGTKEAKAVAEKVAQTAKKTTAVVTGIPGLSALLGAGTAAGSAADGKIKVMSRR